MKKIWLIEEKKMEKRIRQVQNSKDHDDNDDTKLMTISLRFFPVNNKKKI